MPMKRWKECWTLEGIKKERERANFGVELEITNTKYVFVVFVFFFTFIIKKLQNNAKLMRHPVYPSIYTVPV